ncbi:hypothetical protein Syun_005554 [Stephania yunnanensis]|uniref:Small auxin up regulated protein n=1 Tax=Stephania yunnanensis TaxID=152371 RepID=A0AAP0L4X2_9MAGN
MINSRNLVAQMSKKWQRTKSSNKGGEGASLMANKGHFVVYSTDNRRYVVPLEYLSSNVFKELFKMSEEDYGLPRHGPITLPCDAMFMEYAMLFVKGRVSRDLENSLLNSIDTARIRSTCSTSLAPEVQYHSNHQVLQCF